MWEFIKDYVKTCNMCMYNKSKHHKPYGLLKQLPIPPRLSQTSFGHISINSSSILTVLMAMESP